MLWYMNCGTYMSEGLIEKNGKWC